MGVKVTFLGEEEKQAKKAPAGVVVPQNAVRDDRGEKIVFLVKGDRVERHAVKVGTTNGTQTQVLAGLAPGDTVVVGGPADMRDGEAVAIKR
jgi:HlyD family secretion protein